MVRRDGGGRGGDTARNSLIREPIFLPSRYNGPRDPAARPPRSTRFRARMRRSLSADLTSRRPVNLRDLDVCRDERRKSRLIAAMVAL